MKTSTFRGWRVAGCCAAMALGATVATAEVPDVTAVRVVRVMTSDQFLVNGEVTARTDTDFTVFDAAAARTVTIQVSDETTITRGAANIPLGDLRIGEKVSVTVKREANGRLVATKVMVRQPEDQ